MKCLRRFFLPVLLSLLLTASGVIGSYVQVQASVAITGIGLAQVLETILASFGVTYMTTKMFTKDWTDGGNALDPDWQDMYESMENSYEKQWEEHHKGGGDPTPTPEPEENIPHFDELVRKALDTGKLDMPQFSFDFLKTWMQETIQASKEFGALICDKTMPEGMNVDLEYIKPGSFILHAKNISLCYQVSPAVSVDDVIIRSISGLPLCLYRVPLSTGFTYSILFCYDPKGTHYGVITSYFKNGVCIGEREGINVHGRVDSGKYKDISFSGVKIDLSDVKYMGSYPIFDTKEDALEYLASSQPDQQQKIKPPIWVTPDLQDTYENNGKYEYPVAPPGPLNLPTPDQLADLARRLNPDTNPDLDPNQNPDYNPGLAPGYVQDFINELNPSVNPDPDPGTDPDKPSPSPTPTPKPEEPGEPEEAAKPFLADLKTLFPFCIPFDLIHAVEVLKAEPVAPVFKIPFRVNYRHIHVNEEWELDFGDYEPVIRIFRLLETLGFTVSLILVTRNLIKG